MNHKNRDKKLLIVLAIGLAAIVAAYYLGKEVGQNLKESELNHSVSTLIKEFNSFEKLTSKLYALVFNIPLK